jgi:uroporphyrinogen-III synthase
LQKAASGDFEWLVLTSANTANILGKRIKKMGLNLNKLRVAVIGPQTCKAAKKALHIDIDVTAESFVAEGLLDALPSMKAKSILVPQSSRARPALVFALKAAGADVTAPEAYKIVKGEVGANVPQLLENGQIDAVLFSSASTVTFFIQRLDEEGGDRTKLAGVCLGAIGPITARRMNECGLQVDVMPDRYTLADLVETMDVQYQWPAQKM